MSLPFLNPACSLAISLSMYGSIPLCIIFSSILLVYEINAMVRLFEHMCVSPFFGSGIYIDLFQSVGHSLVSHIFLQSVVIILSPFSPAALTSSIGILSTPGNLLFVNSFSASFSSSSKILGSFSSVSDFMKLSFIWLFLL